MQVISQSFYIQLSELWGANLAQTSYYPSLQFFTAGFSL